MARYPYFLHVPGPAPFNGQLWSFSVWVQKPVPVDLVIERPGGERRAYRMKPSRGWRSALAAVRPGDRYWFVLDGERSRPDPASRLQPDGVHGPSAIVSERFPWTDGAWRGIPLRDHVLYEIHTGTFTPEGTFAAIIPRLRELERLGVTAIELMPVSAFPGHRNWGYDGVFPWAVHAGYGGRVELKRLVNACHNHGIAVILDVVLNHLGPEGCYLREFGEYFTKRHRNPWGDGLNFDGRGSANVRQFFLGAALRWLDEFHVDGLRLDATCFITDDSPLHLVAELSLAVAAMRRRTGRHIHLFAEHGPLDTILTAPHQHGGWGVDAAWGDDFHHALRAWFTGERAGCLKSFGGFEQIADVMEQGFSRMKYSKGLDPPRAEQLVAFTQNHDQVANRASSRRPVDLYSAVQVRLAAVAMILGPFLPMLFMGEEYGETAPFYFFTEFGDPGLAQAVKEGRQKEYAALNLGEAPPDPQQERTFRASRLNWSLRDRPSHAELLELYRRLLELRRWAPRVCRVEAERERRTVTIVRQGPAGLIGAVLNFDLDPKPLAVPAGESWRMMDVGQLPAELPPFGFVLLTSER